MNQHPLGKISLDAFLAKYWQKQPLLIRNAFPDICSPLSAEELAGLACESHIESRLIINQDDHWQLQHGPFSESIFSELPESHWTLLVQAVDHYMPAAADLLEQFNFIPRWRIDDLMVSYASKGGGVGPHYDNYDVFLIQTQGQRLWHVGGCYDDHSPLKEGLPVKIVENFEAQQSWLLNPGDILYVPPGVGHNGIAQSDDCMTCSVGFYAPSHSEILREYTEYIGNNLSESERYQDTDLRLQNSTGEISADTLEKINNIVSEHINNSEIISDWFGRYITTPKYQQLNDLDFHQSEHSYSLAELKNHLASNNCLVRNESSRFAFIKKTIQHDLFVDGDRINTHPSSNDLIELLCNNRTICPDKLAQDKNNLSLLLTLLNRGALYLTE